MKSVQTTFVPMAGLLLVALGAMPARAAFVAGVEQFNGTVKDTTTWYQFTSGISVISQNDALTEDGFDGSNTGTNDYVTNTLLIGVGDIVSVEVKPYETGNFGLASLILTNDSLGTGVRTLDDSQFIGILWENVQNKIYAKRQGGSGFSDTTLVNSDHSLNTTLVYQIERISSTSAKFSVLDTLGNVQGTEATLNFSGINDNLKISLTTQSAGAVYDNVRVNVAVPEPATAATAIVGLAGAVLVRRRRRGL